MTTLKKSAEKCLKHPELTLHLVKSLTELGPNLTCWRAVLTKFVSKADIFSAVMGSGRLKLFSQTAII